MASTRTRGTTAAIVLVAAIIGLPIALGQTVGDPIAQWPSISSGELTDPGVIAILATVFWLAWLTFVIPAALEIVLTAIARATRRPQRQIRLPLLGAQQDLARNLISAVLLLLPAASTAIATASPATHQSVHLTSTTLAAETHQRPTTTDVVHHKPTSKTYVIPDIGGMRSYWALAEHFLGDGARWREIWRINEGRVHADGTVMDSPRQLHAGWTILIPTDVDPKDQPPVRTPRDVTVKPGDTLSGIAATDGARDWRQLWKLNADRKEPNRQRFTDPNVIRPGWTVTLPEAASHPPPPAESVNRRHKAATAPHHPVRSDPGPRAGGNGPPSERPPAVEPTEPSGTATNGATPTAGATSQNESQVDHDGHSEHRFPVVPLGIGLAAAASVAALDRARRIAQRRRRIGYRPLPPPVPLRDVEARIRCDARRSHPTIAAINLAASLTGTQPVTIRAVIAHDGGAVDLLLEQPIPAAPPPFVEIAAGWRLPADATGFAFASTDADGLDDPCPVLVPLGSTVDGQILFNLAATGPVSIAGDRGDVEDYLRQTLTALHAAPWAGRMELHVPPEFGATLGRLERLTIEDDSTPQPPAAPPFKLAGDAADEEPGWRTASVHVYCGWTGDADLSAILQAAGAIDRSIHVVVVGAHPDTTTWTLDGKLLTVPGLPDRVTIPPVESDATSHVEALLEHTETALDIPVGDPRLADTGAHEQPPVVTSIDSDRSPDHFGQPRLRLLGPVELDGTGRLPRSQALNLLTLLALHPRGVDRHQLLAALWPEQVVNSQTMRNRIRETRRLVDGGITDGPIWRLASTVTTDWEQFKMLSAGDIEQQRRALELVRGRPFAGLDDADWIDLGGFRTEVEAAIVDVALTVTEHDLQTENYPGALAAARTGLQASRYEERLHRAGIRAAAAQGKHGLAKTMQQEMRRVLDIDIEPDDQIQPETLSLARELRDRRPVASDTSRP